MGNSQALNNADIVDFLTRSSSAMAEANNSLEETIALGTAATEITRDASSVGNALKTVSMRLRGYDEETEQLSDDLKSLSGDIADLTKSAQHPMGVSIFTDETRTTYKSTYQILKDISGIYEELSDKQQAELLEKLASKRNSQVVAAILNNFDAVNNSLETMQNSAGNAEKEMGVIMDSIEYKTNRLKETAVGIAQDIFQRDSTKNMVDNLTSLLEIINKLTTSIGGLGTAFTGLMAYKGLKGQGIFDVFGTGVSGVKGVKNFFTQPVLTQQSLDLGLTEKSISQLKQYTTLIEQGATRTQAFKQAMVGATPATKAAATEIARGNVSLNQLTTSSRAAAIGMRLFNAALNAGIMYIISIGIKALNDLAHAEENAMKAAQENVETTQAKVDEYKSQQEQIDELIEKYKALREAENNDNTQTRSQLVGLQEQITNLVGGEADNLDLVNGRLDEQLAKLKEIKNLNFADTFESAESAYDAAVEQAETFAYHKGNSVFGAREWDKNIVDMDFKNLIDNRNTQIGNEIVNQVLEELGIGSAGFNMDSFDAYYEIKFDKNTDLKQRLEAANKMIEALRVSTYDTSQDNDLYEAIKEYRNELQSVVEAQENSAKQMVDLYTQQVVDDKLSQIEISSFKEYETAKRAMIKDISRQQSIQDALFEGVISQADIENAVNNYMAGLDEVSTYYNAWLKNTTQGSQSDYEKAKSMLGLQDVVSEFNYADYKERIDEVEKSLGKLASAYSKLKSEEMTSSDVLSLIDEFPELAPYANDMSDLTDKVKELGQQTAEPLITSLNALAKTVKDPEQKASLEALVINLQKMASLSEGIKKTADAVQRVTAADYIKWEEDNIQKIIDKLDKEKDAQNEVLDSLKSQKETLEQTISDYEKVADVVGKYIDRTQIQPLNDRKTEIEEYYNTEIEKLKEENEERSRNIELQEKQDALANARKQKNRVYTETEGWVWKQNNKAIRDAQKDLTDLQNTMSIESLEKTRDAEVKNIDEQIKSWEKYKDEWKRQVEQITEADNELMASKVLGVDWQDQVANQSVGIMTTYGNEYASYNNRLKNQVEVEIAQTEKVINERDKEIEEWKNYKNDISNLNKSIETSNEAYLKSLNNLVLDENSTWEDRINHLKRNVEIIKQLNAEAESANLTQFDSGMYTLYQGDELVGWGYSSADEAERERRKIAENIAKNRTPQNAPAGVIESIIQSIMNSMHIKKYARGGVNTTTGLSWLDGTQGSSEVVFNAAQAKQLYDIVHNGDFGRMMGENILSGLRDVLGQIKYKNGNQSTPNVLNVSFPNANINAESYESFKGFMDKYTNDLFMQLQTGRK